MYKIALLAIAVFFVPLAAYAEVNLSLESSDANIKSYGTVLVYGKISGVNFYTPVTLSVIAPDGETIYSYKITADSNGELRRLIHPPISGFKEGAYDVILSHPKTDKVAQISFSVISEPTPRKSQSPVIESEQPQPDSGIIPNTTETPLFMVADAVNGDTVINISGKSILRDQAITITVTSPQGNLVTIDQVMPDDNGEFHTAIITGGPLWKENGDYTMTANQGRSSELEYSVTVEILDGAVIPEFGTIATLVLVVSIMSIIVLTKSRTIFPKL